MTKSDAPAAAGRPPRSKPRRGRLRLVLLVLLLLLAGAVTAAAFWPTTRWATARGYVNAEHQSEVYPSAEGAIAARPVRSGTEVEEGQLLIELDAAVQRAARDEAVEQLAAAEAELRALQSRQKLDADSRALRIERGRKRLELLEQRLETMTAAASGSFSPQELRQTRGEVAIARSELAELELPREQVRADEIERVRKRIAAHKSAIQGAEAELEQRKVRAPHAGMVRFHRFEIGEVVKPADALGQVFDTSGWVVKLTVPERHRAHVKVGQRLQVELASYPSWRHGYLEATVTRVMPVVTPRATGEGVFQVQADLADPSDERLQPGVGVRARIDTGRTTWLKRLLGWN